MKKIISRSAPLERWHLHGLPTTDKKKLLSADPVFFPVRNEWLSIKMMGAFRWCQGGFSEVSTG